LLSGPDAVMEELNRLVNTNSSAAAAFGTDTKFYKLLHNL
jgi:hypothetical protein